MGRYDRDPVGIVGILGEVIVHELDLKAGAPNGFGDGAAAKTSVDEVDQTRRRGGAFRTGALLQPLPWLSGSP